MSTSWKQAIGGAAAVADSSTQQSGLPPRAQAMFDPMTVAANIEPNLDSRYLVKGWLDRGAMSVVYGPSNVGKTFFALDVAIHVAAGQQWHGSRVNGGPVLYIVGEGGWGFLNRVVALQEREFVPLWCLPVSVDLSALMLMRRRCWSFWSASSRFMGRECVSRHGRACPKH